MACATRKTAKLFLDILDIFSNLAGKAFQTCEEFIITLQRSFSGKLVEHLLPTLVYTPDLIKIAIGNRRSNAGIQVM